MDMIENTVNDIGSSKIPCVVFRRFLKQARS